MKLKFSMISLLFFAVVAFTSCKVSLVPSRSPEAIAAVQQASASTDNLYNDIIGSSDKTYSTYADNYQVVNQQIEQILVLDSARNKAKVILIIANDIQKRFAKYEAEHKDAGSINNSEAQTYKDYMHALFSSLLNAESNFK